jgi:hypothetical protein
MDIYRQIHTLTKKIDQLESIKKPYNDLQTAKIIEFAEENPSATFEQDNPSEVVLNIPLKSITREELDYIKQSLDRNPNSKFSPELNEKYDRHKIIIARSNATSGIMSKEYVGTETILSRKKTNQGRSFTTPAEIKDYEDGQGFKNNRPAVYEAVNKVTNPIQSRVNPDKNFTGPSIS